MKLVQKTHIRNIFQGIYKNLEDLNVKKNYMHTFFP